MIPLTLDDFIEAMQIFRKYANPQFPVSVSEGAIRMNKVFNGRLIKSIDADRLAILGFVETEYPVENSRESSVSRFIAWRYK
jgi:hypothetical protein